MKPLSFWVPRPLFSAFLVLLWLLLVDSLAMGQLLLGIGFGITIPFLTHAFWPEQARISRPLPLFKYFIVLLRDILWSNLVVAGRILGPSRKLTPGFFTFPLELDDDFAITIQTMKPNPPTTATATMGNSSTIRNVNTSASSRLRVLESVFSTSPIDSPELSGTRRETLVHEWQS